MFLIPLSIEVTYLIYHPSLCISSFLPKECQLTFVFYPKPKTMEENGMKKSNEGWVNLETNPPTETEEQSQASSEHDTFNGNNLLRELLADEISEGM